LDFVCAHRRADAAATNRHSAVYFLSSYRFREGDDIVGIVIALIQSVSAEIDDLMSRFAELLNQLFFQINSTVIGGYPNSHISLSVD
jgi:hypothetical protein